MGFHWTKQFYILTEDGHSWSTTLENKQYLWDRMIIYTFLKEDNIPGPKHYFVVL
jgi:hypothetical protein